MEPEEMEAHGPSFSCCVVPNFFQFIHLVSACLLPSEICPGPLLNFLSCLHLLWEMGSDWLGPGAPTSESTTRLSDRGEFDAQTAFWTLSDKDQGNPLLLVFSVLIFSSDPQHMQKKHTVFSTASWTKCDVTLPFPAHVLLTAALVAGAPHTPPPVYGWVTAGPWTALHCVNVAWGLSLPSLPGRKWNSRILEFKLIIKNVG